MAFEYEFEVGASFGKGDGGETLFTFEASEEDDLKLLGLFKKVVEELEEDTLTDDDIRTALPDIYDRILQEADETVTYELLQSDIDYGTEYDPRREEYEWLEDGRYRKKATGEILTELPEWAASDTYGISFRLSPDTCDALYERLEELD